MTTRIKIDKNIPLPPVRGYAALKKYPFSKMKIGESLLIEACDEKYAFRFIYEVADILQVKFKSKMTPQGRRVWKVSNKKTDCNNAKSSMSMSPARPSSMRLNLRRK